MVAECGDGGGDVGWNTRLGSRLLGIFVRVRWSWEELGLRIDARRILCIYCAFRYGELGWVWEGFPALIGVYMYT